MEGIFDFSALLTSEALIALLTLTLMEIVLGIDNIVFLSIIAGKLPLDEQPRARTIGLMLALIFRIALLLGIKWLIGLTEPLFTIPAMLNMAEPVPISVKDLIMIAGGLFLIGKSVTEMHAKLEGSEESGGAAGNKRVTSFFSVIVQIVLIDMVFSFDSILTAVGLADEILVMIIAVVISIGVMIIFAGKISDFINKQPTIKMLALAFLILIGFMLLLEGLHRHIDKGYIYFAMAFSLGIELLNNRLRRKQEPVQLHHELDEFVAKESGSSKGS